MDVADADGESVDAGFGNESRGLIRIGRGSRHGTGGAVLVAGDVAEFGFDPGSVRVGGDDGLLGEFDVVGERELGAVDHHRAVAGIEAVSDLVEVARVVEVHTDVSRRVVGELDGSGDQGIAINVTERGRADLGDDGLAGPFARGDDRFEPDDVIGNGRHNGAVLGPSGPQLTNADTEANAEL